MPEILPEIITPPNLVGVNTVFPFPFRDTSNVRPPIFKLVTDMMQSFRVPTELSQPGSHKANQ